jgi:hypothetical protein
MACGMHGEAKIFSKHAATKGDQHAPITIFLQFLSEETGPHRQVEHASSYIFMTEGLVVFSTQQRSFPNTDFWEFACACPVARFLLPMAGG